MPSLLRTTLGLALAAAILSPAAAAGARDRKATARRHRPARAVAPEPPRANPAVDRSVACSCTSRSSCPAIGTLAISGYRAQPLYCNQLDGAENPGVRDGRVWYFQCVELANRWLVESVGAPRIEGHAEEMCDNADRSAYDVHRRRDGAYEPVPGDLLVWRGGPYGHVAVVQSVSPTAIVVANQNYGRDGRQYPLLGVPRSAESFGSPRGDRSLHALCVIHPKALGGATPRPAPSPAASTARPPPTSSGDPCARVGRDDEGWYCGGSRQSGFAGGDPRTLYTCRGGVTTSSLRCPGACTLEAPGRADHCSATGR